MNPSNAQSSSRSFHARLGAVSQEKAVFRWMPDTIQRFLAGTTGQGARMAR